MTDRSRTPRQQELYDKYKNATMGELRELDDDTLKELVAIKGSTKGKLYTSLGDRAIKILRERTGVFSGYRANPSFGIKKRL